MSDVRPDGPFSSQTASMGRRVTLDHISKRYGCFIAVDDVSFTLEPGEFLTLLGPSGSGKTSILMMVAGFENPSSGAIAVDGVNVVSHPAKARNFGVVFQGYALFPHMSARDNVAFPLRMRGVPLAQRRRMADDMLDKVGLTAFAARRPRELSGGQQQRVALARALVFNPNALLLDEPLGALDKNMRERMQDEIRDLQRRIGISILFVTHDQTEAMTMSDRIAVMNAGRIVQIGAPEEIYHHPTTAFVAGFFGETNLLPCEVGPAMGAHAKVTVPGGAAGPVLLGGASPSGASLLSVRPERVRLLAPADRADFELDATVTECRFRGQHFHLTAQAGDHRYAVLTDDRDIARTLSIGAPVRLGWRSADAQMLQPEVAAHGT